LYVSHIVVHYRIRARNARVCIMPHQLQNTVQSPNFNTWYLNHHGSDWWCNCSVRIARSWRTTLPAGTIWKVWYWAIDVGALCTRCDTPKTSQGSRTTTPQPTTRSRALPLYIRLNKARATTYPSHGPKFCLWGSQNACFWGLGNVFYHPSPQHSHLQMDLWYECCTLLGWFKTRIRAILQPSKW
jgi:hypothetical protein